MLCPDGFELRGRGGAQQALRVAVPYGVRPPQATPRFPTVVCHMIF